MNHSAADTPTARSRRRRGLLGAGAAIALGIGLVVHLRAPPKVEGMQVHPRPRPMPSLHFVNGHGKTISLADWHGRAVLLNIWATWCAPCREEMPALDRLHAALAGPAFDVVALSIDANGLPAVQAFFRSIGVRHLEMYLDAQHEADQLALGGIPLTLLIDTNGREVARKLGPARWDDEMVRQLIRQFLPASHAPTP